jgi:hypothetical protein
VNNVPIFFVAKSKINITFVLEMKTFIPVIIFIFFISCSTTRYISEGQFLLDRVSIEMDDRGVESALLMPFIQQTPNSSQLGLRIYNLVDNDSNFFKRIIRRIGEPPVIFKPNLVDLSVNELSIEMQNRGYFNSQVSAQVDTVRKRAAVTYLIHNGEPYRIRNFTMDVPQMQNRTGQRNRQNRSTNRQTDSRRRNFIQEGNVFDMSILEEQRTRITSLLRNQGYFTFTKDNLHYLADTTLRSNQVDLTLIVQNNAPTAPYTVQRVNVFSGFDPFDRDAYEVVDSMEHRGLHIYYDKMRFLRPNVIANNVLVRPNELFRERQGESTFNLLQALSCVSRVNLQYVENNYPDSTLLDCHIYLTPGDFQSLQAGIEGTNKAGDLGIAVDLNYGNLNVFNGSEIFNIRLRAAYEFVTRSYNDVLNHNYYELGISPSLTFPRLHLPRFITRAITDRFKPETQYSLGYNIQRRPEYMRNFFNFNWKLRWSGQRTMIAHSLSLVDINYVNMPWKSEYFQDFLNNRVDSLTKFSYDNVFTAGINYGLIYTNRTRGGVRQNLYTIRFNAETSGNALNWIFSATDAEKTNGQYTIWNNPFAQYVKGDIDFSYTFPLNSNTNLAFRAGIGLAYPYGNSKILPFEKRYYAGGPNNVRGWSTRHLGPGAYNQGIEGNPTVHVGDINFILNAEYRFRALSWLEPAFFLDAGNIWTIKDYPNQPDGLFRWNSFYKELAVATGVGLRFDLNFLILRLDAGTRLYDPAKPEDNRFSLFKGNFFSNSAIFIAIGYPF